MGEQTGQELIDAFYKALGLKQLEQCQERLQALEELARREPVYQGWCVLFSGILANYLYRDWAKGERLLRSLLDTDPEPSLRGRILIALGVTYRHLGRWREAIKVYEQCLTIFNQPAQAFDRAKVWKNMAIVLEIGFSQGEFGDEALPQAIKYCRLALEFLQDLENPNEDELWLEATTWNTLGVIYFSRRDWPQATRCYERRIALGHALDNPYGIGAASNNLGEVLHRQGPAKWPEALQSYLKALEIFREFDDRYEEIDVLTNLGSLHREMGELDRALDDYDQALALAESIRVRLTAPTTQADYRTTIESLYTAPLSLHLQRGDAVRAFAAAERARSRVLADLLAGQAARPHAEIAGHLLERRAALRQALDQAYAQRPPPADLSHLEESLADLDRQIELLDPAYASLETVASLTAEEVGERLPPGSALLAYAGDADDQLWILVVTAAGVRAEPVKNVAVRWLRDYLAAHLDGARGGLVPKPQTGHLSPPHLFPSLYQALIAPVWDALQTAQTVYVVPFGPLHYLPLGALTSDLSAPPPLLAQGRRVVYAPSATILLNYCHARPPSPQQGLLAVAPHDEQLQFTLGAAETIARQGGGSLLIGPAATCQALLAQAGRYRALCFLGHAFFDQRYPMSSRLKLSDGSLHASEILRELRLRADLVILSACETGRSRVLRGDEILGLSRAMLYAGTPSLLVTLWPVHEIPTRLLVEKLIEQLPLVGHPEAPFDPALALAATQRWLRNLSYAEAQALLAGWGGLSTAEVESHLTVLWQMTHPGEAPQAESQPFAHPFFWSPYILIGDMGQEEG